jgi:peptidoglycan lytic transglycosylase
MHRMNRYRLLALFAAAALLGAGSIAGAKGTADAGKTDEKKPAAAGKSSGTTKAGKPGSAKHGSSKASGSKASHSEGGKAKAGAKDEDKKAGAGKSSKRETKTKSKHKESKKESKKSLAKSHSSKSHTAKSEPAKETPKTPAARPTTLASVDPGVVITEIEPASVSSDEIATVREAAGLIRRGRASEASAMQASVRDPAARKLIEWLILRHDSNGGADFARYAAFIRSNPTWPNIPLFRRRAEGYLWHEHSDPATVRAFFAEAKPASARGRFVLGRTLIAQGQRAAGEAQIREGWRREDFTEDLEEQVLEEFPHVLTRADHLARMHRRLYLKDFAAALRNARRVGDAAVAIVKAYSAVNGKSDNAATLLDAVPADARPDAAYSLARIQWLIQKDRIADAGRAALAASHDPTQVEDGDAWWRTRRMLVRKLLDAGDPQTAYRVAREAALPSSENYRADHHFTSGWVALRFLNDPTTALAHFHHIGDGITNPIALARASYWQARAYEALGRHNEARAHYETAARYPTAFYGQLARAKLGITGIAMRRPEFDGAQRAAIANLEVVRAAELLYAIGERELIIPVVMDLADRAVDPAALLGIAEVTSRHQDARATLLLGKAALGRGLPFEQYAFPNFGVPAFASVAPEIDRSISYAIVRQESEFNQRDVSPAKAVGLMQVTPEAGRDTAKRFGVKYDWKRMVNDATYNCQMGAAELSALLVDYRGSYILTFAGYNAGRGRVKEWIERHGDPRDPNVDPIDWIERIPFSETRNYVQRVMENFQMYRVRFGQAPRLTIEADLRRGAMND